MRRRAFTTVELMISIAIIMIVAGISYPLIGSAKRSAYERQACSDMKQIAMSAIIYSADWKSADYGDMVSMGLPAQYSTLFGIDTTKPGYKPWPAPPIAPDSFKMYYWMPLPASLDGRTPYTWAQASLKFQDQTILVSNPFAEIGPSGRPPVYDFSLPNRIDGVNLGGQLVKKQAYGEWDDFTRWLGL